MIELLEARARLFAAGELAGMSEVFRTTVLERCALRSYKAGESIYGIGDPPGGIHGLVGGAVAFHLGQAETGPYFSHIVRAGFWFGQAAALTDGPRRVGAPRPPSMRPRSTCPCPPSGH